MDTHVRSGRSKIHEIFAKFQSPATQTYSDIYLNRLLTHLTPANAPVLEDQFIVQWLQATIPAWHRAHFRPPPNLAAFLLGLAGALTRAEPLFLQLHAADVYRLLFDLLAVRAGAAPLRFAYLRLLAASLAHASGAALVRAELAPDVVQWAQRPQTVYVQREAGRFIFGALRCAPASEFARVALEHIVAPLRVAGVTVFDSALYGELREPLALVHSLLEMALAGGDVEGAARTLGECLLDRCALEGLVDALLLVAKEAAFVYDLYRIQVEISFIQIWRSAPGEERERAVRDHTRRLIKCIGQNAQKNSLHVIKIAELNVTYWDTIKRHEPELEVPNLVFFIFQLLPFCYSPSEGPMKDRVIDELREDFITKMIKLSSAESLRIAYTWKDHLHKQTNFFELAAAALNSVMVSRKFYSRQQAAMVFQALVYLVKDVGVVMREQPGQQEALRQHSAFFRHLFETICVFVDEFEITWRDSIETICIMSLTFDFLSGNFWPPVVVGVALKTLRIAISKYMTPNLALLVDIMRDTTMAEIGPLLQLKLHDTEWEVRDSALEVVHSAISVGNTKTRLFLDWIKTTVLKWLKCTKLDVKLLRFVENMTIWLVGNEERFNHLNTHNFYIKLIRKVRQVDNDEMELSFIDLLIAILEHKSGVEWLTSTMFWDDALKHHCHKNPEIAVKSRYFISKLLRKAIETDADFCNVVVKRMMEPLNSLTFRSLPENDISQSLMNDCLCISLQTLNRIIMYFFEQILVDRSKDFRIPMLIYKHFNFDEQSFQNLLLMSENRFTWPDLGKMMHVMQFLQLHADLHARRLHIREANVTFGHMLTNFERSLMHFETFEQVSSLCEFGYIFWSVVAITIESHEARARADACAQAIVILYMMPAYSFSMKLCVPESGFDDMLNEDDLRVEYVTKVFKVMEEDMVRVCYRWRDPVCENLDALPLGICNLNKLIGHRLILGRKNAIFITQSMYYILKDLVRDYKESDVDKMNVFLQYVDFIQLMIKTLIVFFEEYDITWRESVETISIMSFTFEFMSIDGWPDSIVCESLRLLRVSIAKYMAPNLALLVDQMTDSPISLMGPVLYSKLFMDRWELRTETLRIILELTRTAGKKFPSLQKIIMESELPSIVIKMSLDDSESFVRATAIKCLQEMLQVDDIWTNLLKPEKISEKMSGVLMQETEGIVRVEAATFMCKAYEHNKIPDDDLAQLYETMHHASTTDLHWEVKVRALTFWNLVIANHLEHQGMIDGSFPSVTFSKENRKIVTLTEAEIRKRLQKVLRQLSRTGCLGVLLAAIRDDCDVAVCKRAVEIAKPLLRLLRRHKVEAEAGTSPPASVSSGVSVGDDGVWTPQPADMSDEVIEAICGSRDTTLLQAVYAPTSDYGDSLCNFEVRDAKKVVDPNEFLQLNEDDLDKAVAEKDKWLNSIENLDSLLDDMLKDYEELGVATNGVSTLVEEINAMDCY